MLKFFSKVDNSKYYYLYIASCYFTPSSARQLILDVNKIVNLLEVNIYIDRKSALAIRKDVLLDWKYEVKEEFNGILDEDFSDVNLYAVEHPTLFHSKGYALVEFDDDYTIIGGSLVIGSANLTGNGLFSNKGNIECLLDTQDVRSIATFVGSLEKDLDWLPVSELEEFGSVNSLSFMYAMLQEGEFIHPWSDDLRKILSVTYKLSALGIERTKTDSVLKDYGFNLDSLSVSKSYVDFKVSDYLHDDFKSMKRNYGIENHLGHWIPREMYEYCANQGKGFEKFKTDFFSYFDKDRIAAISAEIKNEYMLLLKSGVIEKGTLEPQEVFIKNLHALFDDDSRLMRIFTKLEKYELPYDIRDSANIIKLYNEITQMAKSKKRASFGVRSWLAGVESVSITALRAVIWDEE